MRFQPGCYHQQVNYSLHRDHCYRMESPDPRRPEEGLGTTAARRTESEPVRRTRILGGESAEPGLHLQPGTLSSCQPDRTIKQHSVAIADFCLFIPLLNIP